jgi:hypothetical protein
MQGQAWHLRHFEEDVAAEGHLLAGDPQHRLEGVLCRGEVAFLVELAVVRPVGLGHRAEDAPAMDGQRAVEQGALRPQRRADQQDRQQFEAGPTQFLQAALDLVEQGILEEQVVVAVGRQPQLREYRDPRPLPVGLAGQLQSGEQVSPRVGRCDPWSAGCDAEEALRVGRANERHRSSPLLGNRRYQHSMRPPSPRRY